MQTAQRLQTHKSIGGSVLKTTPLQSRPQQCNCQQSKQISRWVKAIETWCNWIALLESEVSWRWLNCRTNKKQMIKGSLNNLRSGEQEDCFTIFPQTDGTLEIEAEWR